MSSYSDYQITYRVRQSQLGLVSPYLFVDRMLDELRTSFPGADCYCLISKDPSADTITIAYLKPGRWPTADMDRLRRDVMLVADNLLTRLRQLAHNNQVSVR